MILTESKSIDFQQHFIGYKVFDNCPLTSLPSMTYLFVLFIISTFSGRFMNYSRKNYFSSAEARVYLGIPFTGVTVNLD